MSQIGFYYDQTMCAGCRTCEVVCKDKNRLDAGTAYREVRSYEKGAYPSVQMYHYSAACNHCDDPACAKVCPVEATTKREDGTVVQDPEICIGCQSCVKACPYGVPRYRETKGVSGKCDGCIALREDDGVPACVEACPYRCLDFGTIEELEEKYGSNTVRELPAMGKGNTGPNTLIKAREYARDEVGSYFQL